VITVVYNNHAYSGPHSRVINNVPGGRMVETGQFVHDYLGNPDMDMASIAKGFGSMARWCRTRRNSARRWHAPASTPSRASHICSTCRSPARRWLGAEPVGAADSCCRDSHPEGVSV